MHVAIEVHNITKKFGETTVLNGISLSLEKNKIHGLIGRNGSGKTMLLKCICGFVIPTSGTIKVGKQQIGRDCDVPESVGIIIEAPGFLLNYDGYTNLKFLKKKFLTLLKKLD